MKPFDLAAAQKGDRIVTRDLREARFIGYVPETNSSYKVVATVDRCIHHFTQSGAFMVSGEHPVMDLFMYEAPKKVQWVNLYPDTNEYYTHDTESEADLDARDSIRLGNKAYRIEV